VSANWNIFDAGLTKSKVRQADASLVKAKEQAKQASDSAALEVRQAYLNMLEGEKRIQTTDVASQKAQEDMFIAQEKYRAGVGTNLDVIDAQLALTQARTNRIQALYDFNVSKAKLDKAVGNMVQ
jgi:outer membrane protein TolC